MVEPNFVNIPNAMQGMKNVELVDSEAALSRADIVVGLVDHKEFKSIAEERLKEKILIDTRGIWN